ncbi:MULTISPECIES: golvesin C-terminal-like domain-containing protein [unclassified Isoptericola]|uniref:golvesin C-terminal-like domain-containing protein n=1 Tax=unclassified Isoptericola TaxID=2623355 RepID=UPI0036659D80
MSSSVRRRSMRALVASALSASLVATIVVGGPASAIAAEEPDASSPGEQLPAGTDSGGFWGKLFGGEKAPEKAPTSAEGVPAREHLPKGEVAPKAERVRELKGRRTTNSRSFLMSNGQVQVEVSGEPTSFEAADGSLQDIDTTVEPTAKGSKVRGHGWAASNRSNVAKSFFGTSSDSVLRVEADGGNGVTLGLASDKEDALEPVVEGSRVTYPDVDALAGGDLVYDAEPGRVKESIVLDEAPTDPVSFEFTLSGLDGLEPRAAKDGSIGFYGQGTDPVLTMPAGVMFDSAKGASSEGGKVAPADDQGRAVSTGVDFDLAQGADGGWALTVTPDHEWLAAKERVFPVTVDPTIIVAPTPTTSKDTFVHSLNPTTNYGTSERLSVGRTDGGGIVRGLVTFPLPTVPAGTKLTAASLQMYYSQTHTSYTTDVALEAHRAKASWDSLSATWNSTKDLVGELSGTQIVVDNGDAGSAATGSWTASGNPDLTQYAIGGDYQFATGAPAGDSYTWRPTLPAAGNWRVDVHHVPANDRMTNAPYTVAYSGGSKTYSVDQLRGTGGVWTTLGSHPFKAGTTGTVVLKDTTSTTATAVIADAVRFTKGSTVIKPSGELQKWHSYDVTDTVQGWLDGTFPNYGFVLKAADESANGPLGGPRYDASEYTYGGETRNRPKLVLTYGRPGVVLDIPDTIHATGAELAWSTYADPSTSTADDLVEYQVHRSIYQTFTPSAATLVSPVAPGTTTFTDTTAVPTPADSTDPLGRAYYYQVAVKTKDGTVVPSSTQLVRLPKAGHTTKEILATGDTSLSSGKPTTNLNVIQDAGPQSWDMVGNDSSYYGDVRMVAEFDDWGIPAGARITDASLRMWKTVSEITTAGGVYEARQLTTDFDETTATWNAPKTGATWTKAGGDFGTTALGTNADFPDGSERVGWDVKSLVQKWADAPTAYRGVMLKMANETLAQEHTLFASRELESKGGLEHSGPRLAITYLDTTPEGTFYAPETPSRMESGASYSADVTVTNTTTGTWTTAAQQLRATWTLPDGSAVAGAQPTTAALPQDMSPGESRTITAQVSPPPVSEGNKRNDVTLSWQVVAAGTSTPAPGLPSGGLKQNVAVEDPTSDELGLESFYTYAGKNTGAGSSVMTNVASGNAVWSYDAFTNPGRGLTSFARFAYNSMDTSDTVTGYGWSAQLAGPVRLGAPLDFHPNPHPTEVFLPDGDGTTHVFRLDDTTGEWVAPAGVNYKLSAKPGLDCTPGKGTDEVTDAWTMLRPDGTRFLFDCDGYLTSTVDKNGNTQTFTYAQRQSNNKPTKFLTYVTDPAGRQALSVEYWEKGQTGYKYVDASGAVVSATGKLSNSKIYDHVKAITDVSGRRVELYYTDKGLLGQLVDGAGSGKAKTFGFAYDATQGNKNVKLVKITDPRGNATAMDYFAPSEGDDQADHWKAQTITDRLGGDTTFAYAPNATDATLRDATITDDKGKVTSYTSDVRGRALSVTNAKAEKVALTWDADNNVRTLTEANGAVTAYCYDPKTGYPTWQRDAEQNKANGGAPAASECVRGMTAAQAPKGAAVYEYATRADGYAADLFRTTSPAGRVNQFGYDAFGNLTSVTDGLGLATSTAGDYTTTYTYDAYGQLKTATDANGNATTYSSFTPTGYPEKIADALSKVTTSSYDVRGQVLKVTDATGGWTTQAYDVFGRPLESATLKSGSGTSAVTITTPAPVYDANDNVTTSIAPNGATSTATYDKADQVTRTTAPKDTDTSGERATTYVYDTVGNLTAVTEPKGVATTTVADDYTTTYTYDDLYQLTAVTNAAGDRIEYDYDKVGNTVEVRDPKKVASTSTTDFTSRTGYDLNHRPITATDADGNVTRTGYDADSLVTSATDADGNVTTTKYDARGAQVEVKVPHSGTGDAIVYRTTKYEYDEVGNTTRVITPRGVDTAAADDFALRTEYDKLNRPVKQFQPYDPADTRYNKADVFTATTYDAVGRVASTSMPASDGQTKRNTTTFEYFANGWVKKSTDPFGIATTYDYDELGQQTARTLTSAGGSANRTMTWSYFPDGKLKSMADDGVPVGSNEVLADNSDRQSTTVKGTWATGDVTGQQGIDHRTHAATATPGADAFTWSLDVPANGTYDLYVAYPNVTGAAKDAAFTLAHGDPEVAAGSDGAQVVEPKVTVDQSAGAGAWKKVGSYELDKNETTSLSLVPSATGVVVADAVKLVRDNSADADTERKTFTYGYDLNGNLETIDDTSKDAGGAGAGIDAYKVVYDQLNQVSSVTENPAATSKVVTSYVYDVNGQPTKVTHPDQVSEYTYDTRELLATVGVTDTTGETPGSVKTTTYGYTARSQKASETKPNGNVTSYAYFLDGALKSTKELKKDGSTLVASHAYTYDANGNQATDAASKMNADDHGAYLDSSTTYTYDPVDRLAKKVKTGNGASDEVYVHDANANVISQTLKGATTTYAYDRNRLQTATTGGQTANYTYDPFGRQQSVTSAGKVISRSTYDGFDHVVKSEKMDDTGALVATTYRFDPLDRTTSSTSGGKTTDYTYLGLSSEVLTEEVAGELSKSYQYSPWGGRLSQISHQADAEAGVEVGETAYYGYNARTDVETLTDETGNTTATYGYTAYGSDDTTEFSGIDKPEAGDPAAAEPYNAYRYNSKRLNAGSGTYDMGFRDYDPGLNRFTTRDMYNGALADMGLGGDPYTGNRYAFTSGDPINLVEMDGHRPDDCATYSCSKSGGEWQYGEKFENTGTVVSIGEAETGGGFDAAACADVAPMYTGTWVSGALACDFAAAGEEDPHLTLDIAGQLPGAGVLADTGNCAWYWAEGSTVDASISCGAAVPGPYGMAASAGRISKRIGEIAEAADDASDLARVFGRFTPADIRAAAGAPDKAGLTRVGRALQKHSDRPGSVFRGMSTGNPAARNQQGMDLLDEMLGDPGVRTEVLDNVTNIWDSSGRGMRLNNNGTFMGLLEPRS